MSSQHEAFREEAYELLSALENSLLELEDSPGDMELVGAVFRAMHTIKGSGAMFGFDDISSFTHDVETVYDLVRNGELGVTGELVSLSLAARDQIKAMLDASCGGDPCDLARTEELRAAFRALVPPKGEAAAASAPAKVEKPAAARQRTYRIRFRPHQEIALSGTNPLCLLNELRELGKCQVIAQVDDIPSLDTIDPEQTYVFWDVVLTTDRDLDAIRDVFIFVEDESKIRIDLIDDEDLLGNDSSYKKLGDILVERGDLTPEALQEILRQQKRVGEMLVEAKVVSPSRVASALAEQQQVKEVRSRQQQKQQGGGDAASIRVPADRLDRLVDLVGEMVTIQSRLSQTALGREDAELISIAEEVERLTAELRDNTLNIRMLPIGTTFSKFKRLVRDLSQELGKEIELTTAGADTELDKTVIEKLNDPLVHIIRNSIDHGIEAPDTREAAGKKRQGTIRLAAIHSGDSVIIEIVDDGAGLNEEAIRRKAVEKGVIGEQEQLSRHELFQLIFAAGFSTAQKITGVSGRGVGMDVVKRAIEALRGSIDIDSVAGQGTTIRVRIPLTLAIIDSLLVAIGDDCYVIPLSIVEECIELTRADVAAAHGRNLVRVRDRLVPYVHLREEFAILGSPPEIEQVVVTAVNGHQVGFVVDHVIGEHQTVIKSLGRMYRDAQGLSGATILGDGKVALILDIPQLIQRAEQSA